MAELRYNPFKNDWVMVASARQDRPHMPQNWCPFCLGSGRVPDDYEVLKYDNDFPALSPNPPVPDDVATDFFKVREAYGKCEVILYSPEHTTTLPQLSVQHVKKLVDHWAERFTELSKDNKAKYVMIFENRGEVVGVTMPHPHGQIYKFPFVPKKIELKLNCAKQHMQKTDRCLFCDWLKAEQEFSKRVIFENEYFTVIIPFFSEFAFGTQIISKKHIQYMNEFNEAEKLALAETIRNTAGMYDSLFRMPFPYMMCMYNAPVNMGDMESFHFHIEFFTPMRAKDKQQFLASSETGAWAHCNPTAPEEKAEELKIAYQNYIVKDTL
ncbi:MAG TPA: galactose-1-phosphate uridylyltransferase [Syntrophomonas sp.]|nr:galactose-1-phosphate uridylyltransferase [Syntrophomonas sp.]